MNAGIPGKRVIDGRFELLERLGGGGMGLVWRARDLALEREVALKEVRPPDPALLEDDPTAARMLRERVLREARSLARLNHPHVVTIHHIVDAAEVPHPWLVMELVPGGSLHDRLANGPITPAEAARIGRGVLSALSAAHAAGIHHRDVKPGNVLLRADGSPVLTDFGIAALRESTSLTATGDLIGSPEYIAPERIRGVEDDAASDLWSLGMMLYVAVEGQHPLRRATSLATLAAVLTETMPPPVRAGALAPVLDALLVRDPAARPGAVELDRMLAEAAAGAAAHNTTSALSVADALAWQPADLGGGRAADSGPAWAGADRFEPVPDDRPPTGERAHGVRAESGPRYGASNPPAMPEPVNRQRVRNARIIGGSIVGTALVGVLVSVLLVSNLRDTDSDSDSGAKSGAKSDGRSASGGPTGSGTTTSPDPKAITDERTPNPTRPSRVATEVVNLLTPAAIRGVIESAKPVIGGTKVKNFTIYDKYASISAPTENDRRLYSDFSYRDGVTKKDERPGRTDRDDKTIDLAKVNWDALPALIAKADKDLGIENPKSRYVIVDLGLIDRIPSLKVYVSDTYGGAYLRADLDGKVVKMYPR